MCCAPETVNIDDVTLVFLRQGEGEITRGMLYEYILQMHIPECQGGPQHGSLAYMAHRDLFDHIVFPSGRNLDANAPLQVNPEPILEDMQLPAQNAWRDSSAAMV